MRRESGDLLALEVRDLEWFPVCGRPDRLHHVPEVEATAFERSMTQDREGAKTGGEDDDPAGHNAAG